MLITHFISTPLQQQHEQQQQKLTHFYFHPFAPTISSFWTKDNNQLVIFLGQNPKTPINNNPCQTSVFPTVVAGLKKWSIIVVSPFDLN
jgi:hypothetical protein